MACMNAIAFRAPETVVPLLHALQRMILVRMHGWQVRATIATSTPPTARCLAATAVVLDRYEG